MIEALPSDVADVLDVLLSGDDPVHAALRRQVPHLRVTGRCACGCGTAYFDLDTASVQPAPSGPGTVVAAEARFRTGSGELPGEVLVFAAAGYLSWLEVVSWDFDDSGTTLAMARHALRR
ncbi:hypothetical protein [Streptomyces sp. NPDC058291]|jgi:hypothetical protein|uniref:hypothetical protein n=1 Tax=Streptomyces sp. NPDC058291 TaxID=3346427 RepID=UPI0036E4D41F